MIKTKTINYNYLTGTEWEFETKSKMELYNDHLFIENALFSNFQVWFEIGDAKV